MSMGRRAKKRLWAVVRYGLLLALMAFTLLPVLWMFVSSLKPEADIWEAVPRWIPRQATLENYVWAFGPYSANIVPLLRNSLITSAVTALMTAAFAATSGYILGKFTFPGKKAFAVLVILSQLFQGPILMTPWYRLAMNWGLVNTRLALILIYGTVTIPIGVWLMSGFMNAIPDELEEAARMDGCSLLRTFWSVILPLSAPGLVSIVLYAFILAWNDYQYALILTSSAKAKTIQVGLAQLMESSGKHNWGGILATGHRGGGARRGSLRSHSEILHPGPDGRRDKGVTRMRKTADVLVAGGEPPPFGRLCGRRHRSERADGDRRRRGRRRLDLLSVFSRLGHHVCRQRRGLRRLLSGDSLLRHGLHEAGAGPAAGRGFPGALPRAAKLGAFLPLAGGYPADDLFWRRAARRRAGRCRQPPRTLPAPAPAARGARPCAAGGH